MNKLKTIAVLTMSMAALSTAFAAEQAVTESAQAAPVVQPQAGNVELDRIVAVVNNDVITDRELQERTHVVAINLRRQNIQLPPMEQLRAQVLERLIFERAIKQRARETGIRIDDQMVNASIEQIARQNNLSVDQLRQRLMAACFQLLGRSALRRIAARCGMFNDAVNGALHIRLIVAHSCYTQRLQFFRHFVFQHHQCL